MRDSEKKMDEEVAETSNSNSKAKKQSNQPKLLIDTDAPLTR